MQGFLLEMKRLSCFVAYLNSMASDARESFVRDFEWFRQNLPNIAATQPDTAEHLRTVEAEISQGIAFSVRYSTLEESDQKTLQRYLALCVKQGRALSPSEAALGIGGVTFATGKHMVKHMLEELDLLEQVMAAQPADAPCSS